MPIIRQNISKLKSKIFFPINITYPQAKILITADDSTVYTVLDSTDTSDTPTNDDCISANVIRSVTNGISRFTLTLNNDKGKYLDIFNGGEKVDIFADYSVATNQIFRGKIDNIYYSLNDSQGYLCTIEGRDYPEIVDRTVIKESTNEAIDVAIKDVLSNYFSEITFTFWENETWKESGYSESFTQITQNFRNVSGWQCISSICALGEYDCRLDYEGDIWYLRVFSKNSITNSQETAVVGQNILNVSRFGLENDEIRNRITAYGKVDTNVISILTKNDESSQSDLWIKEEIINDSSLNSNAEMEERVNAVLAEKIIKTKKGSIGVVGMPTIKPGEKMRISVPYCGLDSEYRLTEVTMNFSINGFTNSLQVEKKETSTPDLFKGRFDAENSLQPYTNLNAMENSITLFFTNEETLTLINCQENDGKLELVPAKTTGNMTSYTLTTEENVTQGELRIRSNYPNTENDVYEASNDNGISWQIITPGEVFTFSTIGKQVKLRITLNSDSTHTPVYDSACLLVK